MSNPEPVSQVGALRKLLDRTYATTQRTIPAGPHTIRLTGPSSMDELLDELASRPSTDADVADERLPYWAELWPSAIALAEHIGSQDHDLKGLHAIELGCGLGLVGIAAGLRGAQVLLTDYIPAALDFAALNWWENLATPPSVRQLDWREPDPSLKADLLLAADIIYEKRAFEPVLHAFDALLSPSGRIFLSEPRRRLARDFFDQLADAGFQVTSRSEFGGDIDIYQLQRA